WNAHAVQRATRYGLRKRNEYSRSSLSHSGHAGYSRFVKTRASLYLICISLYTPIAAIFGRRSPTAWSARREHVLNTATNANHKQGNSRARKTASGLAVRAPSPFLYRPPRGSFSTTDKCNAIELNPLSLPWRMRRTIRIEES